MKVSEPGVTSSVTSTLERFDANADPGEIWHLDEVYLKINGKCQYLWRAVDQEGQVLDILVQPKRDKAAAERFFKRCYVAQAKHQDKWSQISWPPTRSPVQRSCPMQHISGVKAPTIEQRTHISQRA